MLCCVAKHQKKKRRIIMCFPTPSSQSSLEKTLLWLQLPLQNKSRILTAAPTSDPSCSQLFLTLGWFSPKATEWGRWAQCWENSATKAACRRCASVLPKGPDYRKAQQRNDGKWHSHGSVQRHFHLSQHHCSIWTASDFPNSCLKFNASSLGSICFLPNS